MGLAIGFFAEAGSHKLTQRLDLRCHLDRMLWSKATKKGECGLERQSFTTSSLNGGYLLVGVDV